MLKLKVTLSTLSPRWWRINFYDFFCEHTHIQWCAVTLTPYLRRFTYSHRKASSEWVIVSQNRSGTERKLILTKWTNSEPILSHRWHFIPLFDCEVSLQHFALLWLINTVASKLFRSNIFDNLWANFAKSESRKSTLFI